VGVGHRGLLGRLAAQKGVQAPGHGRDAARTMEQREINARTESYVREASMLARQSKPVHKLAQNGILDGF
jgi:hypothetical protein